MTMTVASCTIVLIAIAACSSGESAVNPAPPDDTQTLSVEVSHIAGEAHTETAILDVGHVLHDGDLVHTDAAQGSVLDLADGTHIIVSEHTLLHLLGEEHTPDGRVARFLLEFGEVFVVHDPAVPSDLRIDIALPHQSGTDATVVQGASTFSVSYEPDRTQYLVTVLDGHVSVHAGDQVEPIPPGERLTHTLGHDHVLEAAPDEEMPAAAPDEEILEASAEEEEEPLQALTLTALDLAVWHNPLTFADIDPDPVLERVPAPPDETVSSPFPSSDPAPFPVLVDHFDTHATGEHLDASHDSPTHTHTDHPDDGHPAGEGHDTEPCTTDPCTPISGSHDEPCPVDTGDPSICPGIDPQHSSGGGGYRDKEEPHATPIGEESHDQETDD